MTWEEFVRSTPRNSIALDGIVTGGPRFCPKTNHVNFDHHDGVIREATMCTALQVYMAIKGGIMEAYRTNGCASGHIYINDDDQDTALAVWLLRNYKKFENVQGHPIVNRIIELTNRWDVTGGAYPMNLDEDLQRQYNWIFEPYTQLRKSGALAMANEAVMESNLEAVLSRLDRAFMGQAEELPLDTSHEIIHKSPHYLMVNEIGGNDARVYLFSQGMKAFISLVAKRTDGAHVISIGRRSQYIPFPVEALYDRFNKEEGLTRHNGWSGSTIVGGSPRKTGTKLPLERIREITDEEVAAHLKELALN
jgi:hypothetical protein